MKRLRPNFQRSKQTASASAAFLVALIFPALAVAVYAGDGTGNGQGQGNGNSKAPTQEQQQPAWMPYELNAFNLLETGYRQESTDPQGAIATLQHAREQSTAAIAHGGGSNAIVMHNDEAIARMLMEAEEGKMAGAASAPQNNQPVETQTANGVSFALVHPSAHHSVHAQSQSQTQTSTKGH